jgi:glycosyltransferase involved in cell wall biosynthesis
VTAQEARKGKVVVAMISRNEEKAIEVVVDHIRQAAPEAEILIVDSSTDATAERAEAKGVTVVRQKPARGYGPAMMLALREAARRGEVVVTMDCDGTYPTADIPRLARMVLEEEWDVVNATRLARRPAAMPVANWLANAVFALVTRVVHGLKVTDVHSGMRAYRSAMLDHVEFFADGPALPVELLIKPARLGYRIIEVPIAYNERIGTTTLNRWSSTVWTFRRIFALSATARRSSVCEEP